MRNQPKSNQNKLNIQTNSNPERQSICDGDDMNKYKSFIVLAFVIQTIRGYWIHNMCLSWKRHWRLQSNLLAGQFCLLLPCTV